MENMDKCLFTINNIMSICWCNMSRPERSLYDWAYRTGTVLLNILKEKVGDEERARNQLRTFLLNLRSEQIPERFRKLLVDQIVSIATLSSKVSINFPREIKYERPWSIDEFYRYSTAIIAGFFDSIFGSSPSTSHEEKKGE